MTASSKTEWPLQNVKDPAINVEMSACMDVCLYMCINVYICLIWSESQVKNRFWSSSFRRCNAFRVITIRPRNQSSIKCAYVVLPLNTNVSNETVQHATHHVIKANWFCASKRNRAIIMRTNEVNVYVYFVAAISFTCSVFIYKCLHSRPTVTSWKRSADAPKIYQCHLLRKIIVAELAVLSSNR